jgi:hypothetical protein
MLERGLQRIVLLAAGAIAVFVMLPESDAAAALNNPKPSHATPSITERQDFREKMLSR